MKHVGNLQYITFLKGLAILGVILVHAPQLIKEINPLIRAEFNLQMQQNSD